ncbi:MAG: protein kinase [Azospirillum sp.]|nr:protein kinase [Azospirillum sp.]
MQAPGMQRLGRYRIDGLLGSGAMGAVYRGFDPMIERSVALKTVRRELLKEEGGAQFLERFRQEARAAGRCFHPNIVALLEYGEDDGVPFLAMEYVDGRSLDRVLKELGRFDQPRAVSIIGQVLDALGFAHDKGIIHRDIKPANVMVLPSGQIKVADFGIARLESSTMTQVGDIFGTPGYMAPEQFAGDPVDRRADLFAAGVLFFEMLTGSRPFPGKGLTEIMWRVQNEEPQDICALNPALPVGLRAVVNRALARAPGGRFPDAAAFARGIAAAMPGAEAATLPGSAVADDATVVLAPTVALPIEAGWNEDLLSRVEGDLAVHLGPMAKIAVRRAARQTHDLGQLYQLLGEKIPSERERGQFLAASRRGSMALSDRASLTGTGSATGSVSGVPPTGGVATGGPPLTGGPLTGGPLTGGPLAGSGGDATRTPELLTHLEGRLTRYLGPIARILVKRCAQNAGTIDGLYLALAEHIPDEKDRAAFLGGIRRS